MTEENVGFIFTNHDNQIAGKVLSDKVLIEIVHAFKDIIIEYIRKRYCVEIN